jgi:hypothetical protein
MFDREGRIEEENNGNVVFVGSQQIRLGKNVVVRGKVGRP